MSSNYSSKGRAGPGRVVGGSSQLGTPEGWLAHIADAPGSVGFVVDDGAGQVIAHQETTAMPLCSVVKVVHLAGYALALTRGRIERDERVPVADWERWYLPGTDGGAHPASLRRLNVGSTPSITVDELVSAMIRESDNAAADWLRDRLGDEIFIEAASLGGWSDVDIPCIAGAVCRMLDTDASEEVDLSRRQLREIEDEYGRVFVRREPFRVEMIRRLSRLTGDSARLAGAARQWAGGTAAATPRQVLNLYHAVAQGELPGAEEMRRHLCWRGFQPGLGTLGFKAGSYPGLLSFGAFLRRDPGITGYAVLLARDLPDDPSSTVQAEAQQALTVAAILYPYVSARLAIAVRGA